MKLINVDGDLIFDFQAKAGGEASLKETLEKAFSAGACLRGIHLYNKQARQVNLSGADLSHSDMRVANLAGANLAGADLRNADLQMIILLDANLEGANLAGANLKYAILKDANLKGADFKDADVTGSDRESELKGQGIGTSYIFVKKRKLKAQKN